MVLGVCRECSDEDDQRIAGFLVTLGERQRMLTEGVECQGIVTMALQKCREWLCSKCPVNSREYEIVQDIVPLNAIGQISQHIQALDVNGSNVREIRREVLASFRLQGLWRDWWDQP